MKRYTNVSENDYKLIKALLTTMGGTEVVELTGRSSGTVWRIKSTDSFEDYKQALKPKEEVAKVAVEENKNVFVPVTAATKADIEALSIQIKAMTDQFDTLAETFAWVVNNAQIDTARKKAWFK